jgi:anti-anti-sigma regulatory factor
LSRRESIKLKVLQTAVNGRNGINTERKIKKRGDMEKSRPIVIKRVPESLTRTQARAFLEEVRPLLEQDRPLLVFDLSIVRRLDCDGVEMLLHCLKEAARRDGDQKLAALSPQSHVVLNLTRAGGLFEIFASSVDAVRSFNAYLPNVVRQICSEQKPHAA